MTRAEIDEKLKTLRDAVERIGQNLVDLEVDSSRKLLEATKLSGESAARWASASAKLTELWQWHGLLQARLEHASKLREAKRFDELEALLATHSIELSTTDVPLEQRTLLGDSQLVDRVSVSQLLRRMSAAFDEVKTVVTGIGSCWETLIPRLDGARRQLGDCRRLVAELGESGRRDVESAAHELEGLTSATTSDPLSVAGGDIDRVSRSLAEIHADLEALAALKRDFDVRISETRALVDRLRALVEEGRSAHAELLVKIALPAAPAALELRDDIDGQLARISALGPTGRWQEARRELDRWNSRTNALLDEAQRIVRANRAPIESRNQFRALLDAYQVKAKHLGMIEDPELEGIFDQAHEALYTAPTDLALVGQLVRRYQQTLNGTAATQEEL